MILLKAFTILSLLFCMNQISGQVVGKQRLSDVLDHYAQKYQVMISYQPKMCRSIWLKGISPTLNLQGMFHKVEKESKMRIGVIDSLHFYVYEYTPICYTITGKVTDADTGEALVGANIRSCNKKNYQTGEFGLFSLHERKGVCKLYVYYPGYKDHIEDVKIDSGGIYNIALSPLSMKLQEVNVRGNYRENFYYTDGGKIEIFLPNDATVASRMGKKDAISILESMPGVTPGNVGKGNLFVRGGNIGSNGFYIDGAPVYSINHLYGVSSVFNTNAIDKIEMYKGNIPSRYGNYTGSITEFFLKNGDLYKHSGEFTIGNFMSDLILQGPLLKEKSSYIVSLRYAYPELYTTVLPKNNYSRFSFSDVYAKFNLIGRKQNRLYFSFFYARDGAKLHSDNIKEINEGLYDTYIKRNIRLRWNNLMFSIRWNKIVSEKLFINTTLYYSKYSYKTRESQTGFTTPPETAQMKMSGHGRFHSSISDYGLSVYAKYFPAGINQIRAGVSISKKMLRPTDYVFEKSFFSVPLNRYSQPSEIYNYWDKVEDKPVEVTVYGEDEVRIGQRCRLIAGLRGTGYFSENISFFEVYPFLQMHYALNKNILLYSGYSSTMQATRLLPSTNILYSFASSVWYPIDKNMKPERCHMLDLSVTYKHPQFVFTNSLYFRYKLNTILWNIHQQASGLLNKEKFYVGKGMSWGTEMLVKTHLRGYNIHLAYALGYNKERAPEFYSNRWHKAFNDIRHSIDLAVNRFFLSGRIEAGVIWSFRSGLPYTQALTRQIIDQNGTLTDVEDYSCRNNSRFKNTHYLNLNLNYHFQLSERIRSTLCFGVYNLYYRDNPYDAEQLYDRNVDPAQISSYQEVSIAPIIPYVSFTIKL